MSLNDELEMARLETRAKFPALEVVVQDGSVYVNFGWSEAVVITPEIAPLGRVWHAEALAWDRTHGVSAEQPVGSGSHLSDVLDLVDIFLQVMAERDADLERLIDSRPED